jgi:hypothetical protein
VFYFFSASRISIIFRKISCCSTRDGRGRVIEGNASAGHDFGNAEQLQRQRKASVAHLKEFI